MPTSTLKTLLLEAQEAFERICDYVYNAEDTQSPYRTVSVENAENIHLEASGMLVPIEQAISGYNVIIRIKGGIVRSVTDQRGHALPARVHDYDLSDYPSPEDQEALTDDAGQPYDWYEV